MNIPPSQNVANSADLALENEKNAQKSLMAPSDGTTATFLPFFDSKEGTGAGPIPGEVITSQPGPSAAGNAAVQSSAMANGAAGDLPGADGTESCCCCCPSEVGQDCGLCCSQLEPNDCMECLACFFCCGGALADANCGDCCNHCS